LANAQGVCVRGVLKQKASGHTLKSIAACSGVLESRSTRNVDAEWIDGSPDDLCYRESNGNKLLDWSKCELTVSPP
jgi:hypothetical protein